MTRCLNCRSQVSERYARVQGDADDEVHECPNCPDSNMGRRINGAAAGIDVQDRKLTTAATHRS